MGGSHLSAVALVRELDRERYEPVVLCHENGPLTNLLDRMGVEHTILSIPGYVGVGRGIPTHLTALLRAVPSISKFIRGHRIEIVHTNDARMHLTWALPCRLTGVRFVWHQRTIFTTSRLTRGLAHLCHRLICISRFGRDSLPASLSSSARVVRNPVVTSHDCLPVRASCRADLIAELGVGVQTTVIAFVGNLTDQKRPRLFVDALAQISEQRNQVVGVMFGDNRHSLADDIEATASRYGLRLHLMGFRHPIEPLLASCDLLIAPAVNEAFGRTLVEAMLVGTPVVGVASGGHKEIIDDRRNGRLVPAEDPQALATAALEVLDDPVATARMCDNARADVGVYAAERHAAAIMDIYSELEPRAR